MKLTVDTSVLIAVLVNEPIKKKLVNMTKGVELINSSLIRALGNWQCFFRHAKKKKS